jgi:hypothetical protein
VLPKFWVALQPENCVCCCSQKVYFSGVNTRNHYLILGQWKACEQFYLLRKIWEILGKG